MSGTDLTPVPMDRDRAISIVAQHIAAQAACERWEMYPDIGEADWVEVERQAGHKLPPHPAAGEFAQAYDFLAARADRVEAVAT